MAGGYLRYPDTRDAPVCPLCQHWAAHGRHMVAFIFWGGDADDEHVLVIRCYWK